VPLTEESKQSTWLTVVGPQGPATPLRVHLKTGEPATIWLNNQRFILPVLWKHDLKWKERNWYLYREAERRAVISREQLVAVNRFLDAAGTAPFSRMAYVAEMVRETERVNNIKTPIYDEMVELGHAHSALAEAFHYGVYL
jgi:hypothetical protein